MPGPVRSPNYANNSLGNLNPIPFRERRRRPCKTIRSSLRIESPVANFCSHGTRLHFGPRESHSSNCYFHQDLRLARLQQPSRVTFSATPASSYPTPEGIGLVSARRCSAIHFQGGLVWLVSKMHFLGDACYYSHPPTVLTNPRLSWCLCPPIGRLNQAQGASLIASHAYHGWPTRDGHSRVRSTKQTDSSTNSKFENSS